MPYPNEHAARLKPPGMFKRFRRTNDKFGKGIHVIWGITKDGDVMIESIRFDADKFTVAEAKKWLKDHGYKPIKFEPARKVEHIEAGGVDNIIVNVLPKEVRIEVLEDREHVVVPMVILTEGVHNGSFGPVYYPKEELEKTPQAWDHKPIVVYHPVMNGQPISACDPVVLNTRKVGIMLNTRYEDGKLKSEGWIDISRVNKVDERIMAAIEAGETMELSTGLFVDLEEQEGEWNGEKYIAIARNFRPDHLALLPDMVGACSIKDGAGFLRNQEKAATSPLRNALEKQIGEGSSVAEIFPDFFIYETDGKLYRMEYTFDGDEVTIKGTPVEVVRETVYRVRSLSLSHPTQNKEERAMPKENKNKEKLVQELLNTGKWSEDEKEFLEGLEEERLQKLLQLSKEPEKKKEEPVKNQGNDDKAPKKEPEKKQEPVKNSEPMTVEQYISKAPEEIQEVLRNSLQVYQEEKQKLIDLILSHKKNTFTKEELVGRPLGELRKIAALIQEDTVANADYSGQGTPPPKDDVDEEPLTVPTLNFS